MAEYIDRKAAYREICSDETMSGYEKAYCSELIRNIPAADVAPVRHGLWEGYSHQRYYCIDDFGDPIYKDGVVYYCSKCRRKTVIKERYCPNCGAKMDLEEL